MFHLTYFEELLTRSEASVQFAFDRFNFTCLVNIKILFTGAIEKQKLVYILNRDAEARLTISSPLEAHKSNTLVYHMVGVDVGFENPMFACLEIDYEEADADPTGKDGCSVSSSMFLLFFQNINDYLEVRVSD